MPGGFALFWCLVSAVALYVAAIAFAGLSAKPQASDLAVVLGNEVLASGQPSDRLKARLDCALQLYRRKLVPLILVSGGTGQSGLDEAAVMRDYLIENSVPATSVITDSQGVNTMMTALNTRTLVDMRHFSRIVIVTQYYHIPRTLLAFRRAGMVQLSAACPRYFERFDFFALLREAIALPVYFIKMPGKE